MVGVSDQLRSNQEHGRTASERGTWAQRAGTKTKEVIRLNWIKELLSLITVFASYVESPGNGAEKKEKVKQMIKDALPDEQWKIDPEFFDFILDVLIDLVVMFLNRGLWKTAMKVLVR